jgi:polyhydroxybutyrate depolymerase
MSGRLPLGVVAALLSGVFAADTNGQEIGREAGAARAVAVPPGAVRGAIDIAGQSRSYWLFAPPESAPRPRPLLFVLHGGATADGRVTFRYGFQDIAAREGFVTVHPEGRGAGWNDGRDTGFLLDRGGAPDDIAFFRAMIARFVADGLADPKRIYVTGGSNGGLMTLRIACEMAGEVAAVAPFSASLSTRLSTRCTPSRPLPILLIGGTADQLMPFDGGPVAAASGQDRGQVIGQPQSFAFWRKVNRCDGAEPRRDAWPDRVPDDGTRITVEDGVGCAAVTRAMIVEGGGHRLPGEGQPQARNPLSGISSREVDGADYIWRFLREASLP